MKPRVYSISKTSQVRILAAPTRQEILDTLESNGPATIATLGALLGRAPDSLYHHIRILHRAGLIRRTESTGDASVRGSVYNLPGNSMKIAYRLQDSEMCDAINAVVQAMIRISHRDFERALACGEAVVEGPKRNLRSTRKKARLDSNQIKEINRHINAIISIMSDQPRSGNATKLHAVTIMMSPICSTLETASGPRRQKGTRR